MSSFNFKSKFRSKHNEYLTKALFYEMNITDRGDAIYTLKREDVGEYKSLYKLYMQEADPTEYRFANKYLEGVEHWERMCESGWFQPYVEQWRRELELKIKSESLARLLEKAKDKSGKDHYTVNKFLLEKGWKEKSTKGRPSKEEIKKEGERIALMSQKVREDAKRLGIA